MKSTSFVAILTAAGASAQASVSNPDVTILGCDALSCSTSDTSSNNSLCNPDGYAQGVGIIKQAVNLPSSSSNLSLSLVDSDPQGILAAPYQYQFTTQKLYVGAPSDLDIGDQQAGCALLFQYQGQTFPFLTTDASPNTTECGDGFRGQDVDNIAGFIQDFDFSSNDNDDNNDNEDDGHIQLPRCEALAQYLNQQIRSQVGFGSYYYSNLVTVTGGAMLGSAVNSTSDVDTYGDCQPVLPQDDYQLYNVLSAQQVLHPESGGDLGMGGRNGTTPVMTVIYESDSSDPEIQLFCMQQIATGNRELPSEQLTYDNMAGPAVARHGVLAVVAGVFASAVLLLK